MHLKMILLSSKSSSVVLLFFVSSSYLFVVGELDHVVREGRRVGHEEIS